MIEEKNIALDLTGEWSRVKAVRITSKSKRIYQVSFKNSDRKYYCMGVSTWMDELMPASKKKHIESWREGKIEEFGSVGAAKSYVSMTADYGTAYGEICVDIAIAMQKSKIKLYKDINDIIYNRLNSKFRPDFVAMIDDDMKKDVSCFIQWAKETEAEFLAFECMVANVRYGLCTPIDVVCMAKLTPKGQKKLCCINIKSGRGQGVEMHKDQLELEYFAFRETYPEFEPNMCIFAPKDYTFRSGTITYSFEVLKSINEALLQNTVERSLLIGMKGKTEFSLLNWDDSKPFEGEYVPETMIIGKNEE
jgi:hypothetical protein